MANFYQVKKTINGVEYTAQFNGVSAALRAVDACYIEGTQNISSFKLSEYVLDNVIVNPKVSVDDFNSVEELNAVTEWGQQVMQGNFRNEEDEAATETKGKK